MVIGECEEYDVSDGQDGKSECRVLFTGPGINSGVLLTVGWGVYAPIDIPHARQFI